MSPEFRMLFSQYAGTAFAKQLAFGDFLDERNWGVDLGTGHVTFGTDLSYPLQLLGSESDGDSSWLWAWANDASNLPEPLLENARKLKNLGEKQGISELVERSYSVEEVNGHLLSMLASGMESSACYYRGPYEGGALYFLVCNIPDNVTNPVSPERATSVLSQVIAQFDVEHQVFAKSFLLQQKYDIEETLGSLIARQDGNSLTVSFDEQGRILTIEGSSVPAPTSGMQAKKKSWQFWKKA